VLSSRVLDTFRRAYKARDAVRWGMGPTPLRHNQRLSTMAGASVYLKCEYEAPTGSFKSRGVLGARFSLGDVRTVVTASAGNHGKALAYWGRHFGRRVRIFAPVNAPACKVDACRANGAEVILSGANLREATELARATLAPGERFISPYDDLDVIAGNGTIGFELADELAHIDAVVIPIGGGGLFTGVASVMHVLRPEAKLIGVEPQNWACYRGEPAELPTLADGQAVSVIGHHCRDVLKELMWDYRLVSEEMIGNAMRELHQEGIRVEGAGATALAALLYGYAYGRLGKNVVVLLTGRNIDDDRYNEVVCDKA